MDAKCRKTQRIPSKKEQLLITGEVSTHCSRARNNAVITRSQHGFVKNKACLTNLISFFDQVTSLINRGNAGDIVSLDNETNYLKRGEYFGTGSIQEKFR